MEYWTQLVGVLSIALIVSWHLGTRWFTRIALNRQARLTREFFPDGFQTARLDEVGTVGLGGMDMANNICFNLLKTSALFRILMKIQFLILFLFESFAIFLILAGIFILCYDEKLVFLIFFKILFIFSWAFVVLNYIYIIIIAIKRKIFFAIYNINRTVDSINTVWVPFRSITIPIFATLISILPIYFIHDLSTSLATKSSISIYWPLYLAVSVILIPLLNLAAINCLAMEIVRIAGGIRARRSR